MPVLDYINRNSPEKIVPPLTVLPTTTFETVVLKLAATHTHRLWIVDNYARPIGVVSITDIMNLLDLRVYIDQQ
jgi:CBS domain containing-hemolysin-like protein